MWCCAGFNCILCVCEWPHEVVFLLAWQPIVYYLVTSSGPRFHHIAQPAHTSHHRTAETWRISKTSGPTAPCVSHSYCLHVDMKKKPHTLFTSSTCATSLRLFYFVVFISPYFPLLPQMMTQLDQCKYKHFTFDTLSLFSLVMCVLLKLIMMSPLLTVFRAQCKILLKSGSQITGSIMWQCFAAFI